MTFGIVLVTGGAGFIGSQLIKRILPDCKHIYVIDNLSTGLRQAVPCSPKITFIEDSITNKEMLFWIMPKVEYVFHLACSNLLQSVEDSAVDFHTNLYGGYMLLDAAHKHCTKLRRFVYASTASVYSDATVLPTKEDTYKIRLPYAASKFSVEHYCDVYYHLYRLPVSVLRLSNVYGPGQSPKNPYCGVVAKFFEATQKEEPLVIYGDGLQTRDFTYIEDALSAFVSTAANEKAVGNVYNVGTGTETSIIGLANEIVKTTGTLSVPIVYKPHRSIDIITRRCIDATKIQRDLQWVYKYPLSEGIEKTYAWMKESGS